MAARPSPSITLALADCRVVVTRPRTSAEPLVRALRQRGAIALRLPAQAVVANPAFDWPSALSQCASIDGWIFTSPAAVALAAPLLQVGLGNRPVFAVGAASAAALRRRNVVALAPAQRQDSEGLLDLPELADPGGRHIVVVGAPAGRGLIASTLRGRGARVDEWPVYRREAARWRPAQLAAIASAAPPVRVLISSTDSLRQLIERLPAPLWSLLRAATWIASSDRVAAALQAADVTQITIAASAGTADLLDATVRSLKG